MVRVCHMTSAHKSQDVRILKKQCTSLARDGYDTYLVATGDSYTENGVNIVGIGNVQGGRLKRMTKVARMVYKKALELDCDIYQIHDPELLPHAVKLKKKGKKVIFDSHENYFGTIRTKEYINKAIRGVAGSMLDRYLKKVAKKMDAVIYASPHIEVAFKGTPQKSITITNPPVTTSFNTQDTAGKKSQLIFAGGVSKQWCHAEIIKAIQNIDVKYVVCGNTTQAYMDELNSLDINNRLDYIGIIPHQEVGGLLSQSSIGMTILKPSQNTGMKMGTLGNTKIYEYMMAELPVICTDFILWKEIIDKYNCGICVDPENIDQIASAITYLLDNPDIAREMGKNGRRAVLEEFNWGIEEKKLLKLYKELSQ